jgi:hypothetical protein
MISLRNGTGAFLLVLSGGIIDLAWADIGPKPTATFAITADNGTRVTAGELLLCEKDDCSDAKPLEELGPQGFFCQDLECDALAYGFAPYLQLRLTLSDGRVLTSQVFTKEAFDAEFAAIVAGDRLTVEEKAGGQSRSFDRLPRAGPSAG